MLDGETTTPSAPHCTIGGLDLANPVVILSGPWRLWRWQSLSPGPGSGLGRRGPGSVVRWPGPGWVGCGLFGTARHPPSAERRVPEAG